MKDETKSSETSTAYGKKLDTPIPFTFSWKAYENIEEVKAANDLPSDEEVVKFRNNQKELSARGKALTAALDAAGYKKPTIENDEQLRLREMFKVLMASKKYTEEQARTLASTTLEIEWAD